MQNAVRGAIGISDFSLTCAPADTHDGSPIRDFVNVMDLADAHMKALDYLDKGNVSEVFNIGTGVGNSVYEIVNAVKEITGVEFEVSIAEPRKGESAKIYADTSKSLKLLKWKPARSIEDSIKTLVEWYKKYPDGWNF